MGETTFTPASPNEPVTNTLVANSSTGAPAANNPAPNSVSSSTYNSNYGTLKFPSFENESDWNIGPGDALQPESVLEYDIPFAPFSKAEKLGRIADWSSPAIDGTSYRRNFVRPTAPKVDEEELGWSFATTDAKPASRDKKMTSGPAASTGRHQGSTRDTGRGGYGVRNAGGPRRGGWGPRFGDRQAPRKREPSVLVTAEWKILEEIEFSRLAKLQLDPEDATHIKTTGKASVYDRINDKISSKHEKTFQVPTTAAVRATNIPALEDDETLADLAAANDAAVIISDYVASLLMAAPRTTVPWDIIVKRRGQLTLLDARPESDLDLLPINETAQEAPLDSSTDPLNSSTALAREAARVKHHLSSALAKVGAEGASALRYSKVDLGEGAVMLVRSQIPAVMGDTEEALHLTMLLEYEHKGAGGMDWKLKLDAQRGAVFAHEIRNNGALLARTVYQSLVAAVDHVKLAYVARISPKDATRHALLGLHEFEPYELASQMNLNVANGFGVLRALIDIFRRLPSNCDYSLMRDPNKPMLRLYKLPGGQVNEMEATIDDLLTATGTTPHAHISDAESY